MRAGSGDAEFFRGHKQCRVHNVEPLDDGKGFPLGVKECHCSPASVIHADARPQRIIRYGIAEMFFDRSGETAQFRDRITAGVGAVECNGTDDRFDVPVGQGPAPDVGEPLHGIASVGKYNAVEEI